MIDKKQQIHIDQSNPFNRTKSMTTVIGIKCKDGIVLTSDSQGTSNDEKTRVKKIFPVRTTTFYK